MFQDFLHNPKALIFSVLVHVVLLGFIVLEMTGESKPVAPQQQNNVTTIKAQTVDVKDLEKQRKAKEDRILKANQAAQQVENKKKAAAAKKKKQADAKNKAALAKKKKAAQKKKAEAKKKAALVKHQKAEKTAKLKAEQEQLKLAAEKRRKQQVLEKAEKEKQQKEKAEAVQKKRIEDERLEAEQKQKELEQKKLADKRRAAEQEQKRKEMELQSQMAAEERQRNLSDFKVQYLSAIQQKIQRNWRQPVNAGRMPSCEVNVVQGPGGLIMDVVFGHCPGTTNYRLSVENAVYKSEPLPEPKDPSLFDRDVRILFKPNN